MLYAKVILAIACGLAIGACSTVSTKLAPRHPDPKDLAPCEIPPVPSAKPTQNEAAKGWTLATRLLLECKAKHDNLIEFDKAGPQ